ncbi:MAG: HEAT repeat domain-containing protein [Candidatus Poseidoniaceae archaeon]
MAVRAPGVSEYGSVDPAPPQQDGDVRQWSALLMNEEAPMFQRMRTVFSLRNDGTDDACLALCAAFVTQSALLRHELAYVLGQMQNPTALPTLIERLSDEHEHIMVRHEAAEAMGAIGDLTAKPILQAHLQDPNPEVAESCEVALDLLNWCASPKWEKTTW